MTPEAQLEFHKKLSESRYELILRSDYFLRKELTGTERPDFDAVSKIAKVRVDLFRELLDMASLTAVAVQSGATQSTDYDRWLELVKQGAADEQRPNKED